jgi:phosphotransferase system enzyme I (PtsI)
MVAQRGEILAIMEALAGARQQLKVVGQAFNHIEVGAMIEVPAAAMTMPLLLRHFDFVSIGTNDLIQYTLAIDRADEAVAHLYDPWHPAVLGLIANVIEAANAAGKPVSVCGEMAGDTTFTELLLGLGLRSLSMHPSQISAVKQRVLRADSVKLAKSARHAIASEDPERAWLSANDKAGARAANR